MKDLASLIEFSIVSPLARKIVKAVENEHPDPCVLLELIFFNLNSLIPSLDIKVSFE